ncbi:SDR family oxidoreductase [Gammaproteobacteria bacterium]|nr:SDR family oxidoreductase [Gammaproteobacteria bacterium]
MSQKILIIGANGMLGGSLFRYFTSNSFYTVLGTVRSSASALQLSNQGFKNTVEVGDVRNETRLDNIIREFKPSFVLNCIGIIKQVAESKTPIMSIEINSLLPHLIAKSCDLVGARLIHFSTDCVFSGNTGLYSEEDIPCATDLYGRSKLLGEVTYGNHLTLRTSIIGHEIDRKLSLVDWFLNQENYVSGYSRAIFSGLPTAYIGSFVEEFIFSNNVSGLYHLGATPINKYDLLCMIKKRYKLDIDLVKSEKLKIDRSLNSNKLQDAVGYTPPLWTSLIETMHVEYEKYFI